MFEKLVDQGPRDQGLHTVHAELYIQTKVCCLIKGVECKHFKTFSGLSN